MPRYPGVFAAAAGGAPAPTFPTVETVLTQGFTPAGTTHNVTMPATVNANDLLMMIATDFASAGAHTTTTPGGWSSLYGNSFSGNVQGRVNCFIKLAVGNEDGTTVDIATSINATMAVQTWRISGWFGSLTGVEAAALTTDSTGTTHDPPSVAPSWGSAKNLFIEALHGTDDDATMTVASTNYTNIVNAASGAGTNAGCETMSARRQLEAASDDPDAVTVSETERVRGTTIVIRPAT